MLFRSRARTGRCSRCDRGNATTCAGLKGPGSSFQTPSPCRETEAAPRTERVLTALPGPMIGPRIPCYASRYQCEGRRRVPMDTTLQQPEHQTAPAATGGVSKRGPLMRRCHALIQCGRMRPPAAPARDVVLLEQAHRPLNVLPPGQEFSAFPGASHAWMCEAATKSTTKSLMGSRAY